MTTQTTPPVVPVETLRPPDFGTPHRRTQIARANWWLAYPVAILLLALLDVALSFWRPFPARLPEQWSPAYLNLYVSDVPKGKPVVAFLGDSVLWGYKIGASQTAVSLLQKDFPGEQMLNLAYEGGSTPNSEAMLRYLLSQHVTPSAVVVNVNVKEFNANDSAYQTLHPSLERALDPALTPDDRSVLTMHAGHDLNAKIGGFMERIWRFYRLRTDLREAIFGTDDMASAMVNAVQNVTGTAKEKELAHRPTPDKFLGTYDLSPIDDTNVGMRYYKQMLNELCARKIPALIFLTPANHALLHDYIDVPDYDANLKRLQNVPHCASVQIVNFDRAIPSARFIDNDHLDPAGQQMLAARLQPYLRSMAK